MFNRWLAEFCAELPGRRAGVGIVQPHDIEVAVRDVHDLRESGLASVMLPTGDHDLPPYQDPAYDPLWAACVDTGLPVTFHSGGIPWQGYGHAAMWVSKFELMWWARRPLWQLIFGGVFERFPDLRVAFTEQGADWIPAMLERLDEQYSSPFERGITEILTKTPTGYWRSNCYVGASFMSRAECDVREQIGVDRIMWGADYPHIEGTWPHSLAALREACTGCSAEEIRMMASETAAVGVRLRPRRAAARRRVDRTVARRPRRARGTTTRHVQRRRLRTRQGQREGDGPPALREHAGGLDREGCFGGSSASSSGARRWTCSISTGGRR